jgi:tRNA (guanine10-N2)-methyltransferase
MFVGKQTVVNSFNLKDRCFIGNTTMDPLLSLVMANMALARDSTIVYDPFVGTGSLLLSSAYFGSFVMGADLDFNLLSARGYHSNIFFLLCALN